MPEKNRDIKLGLLGLKYQKRIDPMKNWYYDPIILNLSVSLLWGTLSKALAKSSSMASTCLVSCLPSCQAMS